MTESQRFLRNAGCTGGCHDEFRPEGLCLVAPSVVDSLALRCVGNWALDKIDVLQSYFQIFSGAMKAKWSGKLNYVEICSGPGRCILRNEGKEFDGTALAILKSPEFAHVSRATFIDKSPEVVSTLNKRIQALGRDIAEKAIAIQGDYHDPYSLVQGMIGTGIRTDSLNLVFVDPTDCSIPFETMRYLHQTLARTDFIVNFPFGTDLNRNMEKAILLENFGTVRAKYLAFLGDPGFFDTPDIIGFARSGNQEALKKVLNDKYFEQLKGLGYTHADRKKIRHFYYLCFFSSNPLGLKFWRAAIKKDSNGQGSLF